MSAEQKTLKKAREDSGVKIAESAVIAGVTVNTINNWETGRSYPNVIQARRLCCLYNVSIDDIIF